MFHGWTSSHATGSNPSFVTTAFSVPTLGSSSYMNRQITLAATKLMASGRKTIVLTDAFVADAIDEHRHEQAEADHQRRQQDDPQSVVPERDEGVRLAEEALVVVEADERRHPLGS